MQGFRGYGGRWESYMNASRQWLFHDDFSNYRRVKVRAGTIFGKFIVKKDFEIVCAWWNRSFSDSYVKDDGTISAHVGVKEWDWSDMYFKITPSDTNSDIVRRMAWGIQTVWGYYVIGDHSGLREETKDKFKECLEERPSFFWVSREQFSEDGKDTFEIPVTETVDGYYKTLEANNVQPFPSRSELIADMARYFWNPQVTGIEIDKEKLDREIGKCEIGMIVPQGREYGISTRFDPCVGRFLTYSRDYSKFPALVKFLNENGFPVVPENEIKEREAEFFKKESEKSQKELAEQERQEKERRNRYKGKWWLVKWSGNWADEIDLEAANVMTDKEVKAFKKWTNSNRGINIYIGTNQDLDTTRKGYLQGCEFVEIKDNATREFLLEHCDSGSNWSPRRVMEES